MVMQCRIEDKASALVYLLREVLPEDEPTIVFVSTKHHVEYIAQLLKLENVECAYAYGAMDQVSSGPCLTLSLRTVYVEHSFLSLYTVYCCLQSEHTVLSLNPVQKEVNELNKKEPQHLVF